MCLTHTRSLRGRGDVWQTIVSPSVYLMMPCWYQRSTPTPPNTPHPHTQIYIVSVPCRTSYGLYRATCFLHVCQLLLRHLQAAQEQKSRADVTHKLTTCWWMIVKSSLTAAVLHKETRLSLSKNTDKHVHAYCSSAAEMPFLSLFFHSQCLCWTMFCLHMHWPITYMCLRHAE